MVEYMQDIFNQQLVADMEKTYEDLCSNIPDNEMESTNIEITADFFCSLSELVVALLSTYEGYGDCGEIVKQCA